MSARPPFEPLPPDPLDREEAALANAYRKLPATEPSPQLDVRILAQARAAATPKRRQRRPWFLGAGFGAAAAAVMAAGVAWQLGWIGGIPGAVMAPGTSQRSDARMQAPKDDEATKEERIDIEFVREERELTPARPTADAATASAVAPPPAVPESPPPQKVAAPPAPPAPAPAPAPASAPAIAAEAPMPTEVAADSQRGAAPRGLSTPAPEPFPAQPRSSADQPEAEAPLGAAANAASAAGQRAREQDGAGLGLEQGRLAKQRAVFPPWTEDERLAPAQWLERIRDRVDAGDRQSAEFSLRRFVQVHPQHAVPRELRRLLVE